MEFLIFLFIVGGIVWYVVGRASSSKARATQSAAVDVPIRVTFTTSSSRSSDAPAIDTGRLTPVPGGYVLNPRAPIPLSLVGVTEDEASKLKGQLDRTWVDYRIREDIAFLIAKKNLRCPEVEAFVAQLKRQVAADVERQRAASRDWESASEKDRRDLLIGFERAAIDALPQKPARTRELAALLDEPPMDPSADDALLSLFGADVEMYRGYMYALSSARSVRVVPADDYSRKRFEIFVEKGLARRGTDIPMEDVLPSLKLKELNELLKGAVEKPVGRKAKAAELALTLPDLKERLGKLISFRELFQVLPPAGMDVEELRRSFAYASGVADLFCETYATGVRTLQTLSERREMQYKGWKVYAEECCKSCDELNGKTYRSKPAKVPPYHVGCVCWIDGIFGGEG